MRILCRLVLCVLPYPLIGFLFYLIGPAGPVRAVLLSCLTFLVWQRLSAWQGIAGPRLGSPWGLLLGLGIGTALTVCCVIAMGFVEGYSFSIHQPSRFTLLRWPVQQIPAACMEETFTRGGTVHFLASFFGPGWAYLGGSVPFALIHFWFARFRWPFFLGLSSAGFMLSAVYIKHGLLAAIGVHFAWNVLSRLLIEMLDWKVGTIALESAWSTTAILSCATLGIVGISRGWTRRRSPRSRKEDSAERTDGNSGADS